ncbi:MAG TPA: dihydroneopterin aldolase [Burkholderiaceae bacterium]|nr:dihydroneopterin aldolase [Burkholderiaceae bacterium]
MDDRIFIQGLRLDAMVGIYLHERTSTNPVDIDLEFGVPGAGVYESGDLVDTIDYGAVASRLKEELAGRRFGLLEEMSQRIADILLGEFGAPWVRVSIVKLGILKDVARVGVSIERRAAGVASPRHDLPRPAVFGDAYVPDPAVAWREANHRAISAGYAVHAGGGRGVTDA